MRVRAVVALPLLLLVVAVVAVACDDDDGTTSTPTATEELSIEPIAGEWPTFAYNLERTGYNPHETLLTKETAGDLVEKWRFPTAAPVAASPVVATVAVPGEGAVRIVVVGSYDGNVYGIRADDGEEVWRFGVKAHPGISYGLIASSATIAEVAGGQRVYVGGGETLYSLDAGTGELLWEFDAGTGCETCGPSEERNEILSSPAVLPEQDMVLFGMDVNDSAPGKGGFYALSAEDGRLRWFFDLETGAVCRPAADDDIRRFDGYHAEADLGLPDGFFSTREGCDFDRTETACGNVWSPVTVDMGRERIFFTSSNCDTDDDPDTPEPPPPMPLYDEALVALEFDGDPAWTWRPRDVDNDDLAFGAAPNLFSTEIEGEERDVLGVGGKDGTYYLLDRDGENELTGEVEPYWVRQVVEGGAIGGVSGTAAVGEGTIFFATAIGEDVSEFQNPSAWALNASDGEVFWSQPDAPPFFGSTSAVPGVAFMGGVDAQVHAFDAETGEVLVTLPLGGLAFSQAAIVEGELFVGSGFGASSAGSEEAADLADSPAGVVAFCVAGVEGCTAAGARGERLFSPQDNQLDVYDLESGEVSVLIPADQNTVNGQVCLLPDSSGNFLMGEDTGQPEERAGWGIFSPEGELVEKLPEPTSPGEAEQPDPFGCAFDDEARLFVTDVGTGSFDSADGKLILFFPPDYERFCVLDTSLRTAATVAIGDDGNVYVAETVPPGRVLRFAPPFPRPDECDSTPLNRSVFLEDPEVQTAFGIARAPNGNWYVSSVLLPVPTIREYDADGNFVRTIVEGDDIGNPAGLAVASDGTIYYADLGLRQGPDDPLPGPVAGEGTVRKVTFDDDGTPAPPEIVADGLSFPDAVAVIPASD